MNTVEIILWLVLLALGGLVLVYIKSTYQITRDGKPVERLHDGDEGSDSGTGSLMP